MVKKKNLSNSFSTGGGGVHFEAHVQAAFVALMLSGGHAPCLPCWPIRKIKLQGKIDGFNTDDLILCVENPESKEQRKLLGQIKHSISITEKDKVFGEVMQAAWSDYNNSEIFKIDLDVICLITGPLSKTDWDASWILNHARTNFSDPGRFFRNIATANFCSNAKREKLSVFRHHLKNANGGVELDDNVLHGFLKSFYFLGYDLGEEEGVVLSLINSHISQYDPNDPRSVWSRILEFTNNRNHHAGHITHDCLPEDLTKTFTIRPLQRIPDNLIRAASVGTDWSQHPDATYLALINLIGSWDEKRRHDVDMIAELLGTSYEHWLQKARKFCRSTTVRSH